MAVDQYTALGADRTGALDASPAVTRRSLLRASPTLLAPCILAGPALAEVETPIMRLFREWDAAEAEVNASDWPLDEDLDEAVEGIHSLEERIASERVTCLADLAAKLIVSTGWGDFGPDKELVAECEAILAGGAA